jgi:hypothetical protein
MNTTTKKIMKSRILAVLGLIGIQNAVQAQITVDELDGTINTITTAVPLLMISPDARAGALGDAGGALSPDANSIHWCSAKLASIEVREFRFHTYPGCASWYPILIWDICRGIKK